MHASSPVSPLPTGLTSDAEHLVVHLSCVDVSPPQPVLDAPRADMKRICVERLTNTVVRNGTRAMAVGPAEALEQSRNPPSTVYF